MNKKLLYTIEIYRDESDASYELKAFNEIFRTLKRNAECEFEIMNQKDLKSLLEILKVYLS